MPPKRSGQPPVKRSKTVAAAAPSSEDVGEADAKLEVKGSNGAAPKKPPSRKRKTPVRAVKEQGSDVSDGSLAAGSEEEDVSNGQPAKMAASTAQKKGRKSTAQTKAAPKAASKKAAVLVDEGGDGVTVQTNGERGYYLMKSEPHEFSIDDQAEKPDGTYHWEGVRNAQAKNIMRSMKVGEQIFFYHSSCKVPGIVGLCTVAKEAYPDHTAWDPKSKYYDERSTEEKPKWWMVDVKFERKTKRIITLEELKQYKDSELTGMVLLNRSRLSVQPVTKQQWEFIMSLEDRDPAGAAEEDA